jgi:dihydroxy-acid dehydratase
VQKELQEKLDLGVMTITGKPLKENLRQLENEGFFKRGEGYLANYQLKREDIVRSVQNGTRYGTIAVLRGNIAPEGAAVKFSAVAPDMLTHTGPARVFNREEDALEAIIQGRIESGSVIVLRYEGPRASGMPEILACTEALASIPELRKTAIVTDGRFSGATRGPCIGHVSPEAARGGPIALLKDGDLVSIDIPRRNLSIVGHGKDRLAEDEVQAVLAARRNCWEAPKMEHPAGVLRRYSAQVVSAMQGAYLEV